MNRELEEAVAGGALVVYTQDWHPPRTPHFQVDGGVWPVHCVAGSWGAELRPDLRVVKPSELVRKGTGGEDGYSAFSVRDPVSGEAGSTGLETLLRSHRIGRVVVAGLATDYCVKETVLDAIDKGFDPMVMTDAVAAVDLEPGDGERALAEMRAVGAKVA